MYLLYVDESGCTNLKDGSYFVISGIIIKECDLDDINLQISQYKVKNFKNGYRKAEIHVHEIWQRKPPFDNIDLDTKRKLLDNLYIYCIIYLLQLLA